MKIILDNLEPNLVENLRYQAEQHGRTLETELKLILTQAVTKNLQENFQEQTLIPLEILAAQVKESLDNQGYHSHEQIIDLVQDVKREMAEEHLLKAQNRNEL
ncbi:MAG: FitA-like ribbon-helix-helix domain-containing protein [Dolichospermum sp.]